ncbi:unnamed protein product [Rotaria sordida]|uniref:Protein-serine/threonine kinase n=1 Tax=Rotaria sordida TaxID=392033 RepID=A0A818JEJ3_9BILA|nr:unnamed protein product [Rotaria sordida]CAF0737690.1 unnamed protein product [Rotaria sordida]CAF0746586.1 unnamed protein product [Rotaria sordida]CAF0749702.1 unnamed protein product [Rotaria sordida]CAF0766799.1 unnamed protein product [Rotaria sordida]
MSNDFEYISDALGIIHEIMRLSRLLFNLSSHIEYYSKFPPTSFTLKSLIDFARDGDIKQSYKFLRVELLIRWSHMRKEMEYLPPKLLEMPSFKLVNSWYDQSYSEVLEFKNTEPDASTLRKFTETLVGIRKRHADVVSTLAQAYMEFEKVSLVSLIEKNRIQYFYDRFFMNRIGIRTLLYQHTLLFGDELPEHSQQAGIIDPCVDVVAVIGDAYSTAKYLFEHACYPVPKVEIESYNVKDHSTNPVTIVYIPSHIYHIVFELLKNSLRATVERYGLDAKEYPPVRIIIVKGHEDLTIQINDRGGGISRSKLSQLFHYMYSTAPKYLVDGTENSKKKPSIAGLGYGLPIARLYAQYFQGNLKLASIENYGTSAYVSLQATAENASERLPIFCKSRYSYTTKKGSDWT